MAQAAWEKPTAAASRSQTSGLSGNLKFMIGGLALLAAVAYLLISGTAAGAQYFITIDDLLARSAELQGQTVRITGAVVGESIIYDDRNLVLDFTVAHVPAEIQDLALALYQAVNDETAARMPVHVEGQVKPDLLQHEAQAIMTGRLGPDGVFYATELLLKCPSRYEESVPSQAGEGA